MARLEDWLSDGTGLFQPSLTFVVYQTFGLNSSGF